MPPEHSELWEQIANFDDPMHPINTREFLFTETSTVAYGRSPEA